MSAVRDWYLSWPDQIDCRKLNAVDDYSPFFARKKEKKTVLFLYK